MGNLLIICQKVDEDDDLLGFFVGWIREFAKNFEKVFVIALGKGRYELPANVEIYSLGKENSSSKIFQFLNFYKFLLRLVPKSDGIFAHMSPIFEVAATPVARWHKKKTVLWYLHRSVTFRLRLAALLSYKIVTASAESLGIKIPSKIVAVGHGIDTSLFKPSYQFPISPDLQGKSRILDSAKQNRDNFQLKILSVGRISPIKHYETLIEAVSILTKIYNPDSRAKLTTGRSLKPVTCSIVGRPVMAGDSEYFHKLEKMVKERGLEQLIRFVGFVPFSKMPAYYKDADIVVNLTPKGGIDKTVLEAMASGALVLASNRVFEKTFGPYAGDLIFRENDPEDLAAKVKKLSELSLTERSKLSGYLKSEVAKNHELAKTVQAISRLFL